MGFLILTVLLSVLLIIIFRLFDRYGVNNLPAIVVNYFVCAGIGSVYAGKLPLAAFENSEAWLPFALLIGLLFITAFFILALTAQKFGIYFTSLMQKTSLIFTVIFAVLYFGDALGVSRGTGIALALLAIYLITRSDRKKPSTVTWTWKLLMLPLVTFLFSGIIDIIFFYLERTKTVVPGDYHFTSFLFGTAGCLGLLPLLLQAIKGTLRMGRKEVIGGILLGIPNFFSIHFYLLAMGALGGALVVPLVSVGTIMCSAIFGYALFREQLTPQNLIGMALAVGAIFLLSTTIQG